MTQTDFSITPAEREMIFLIRSLVDAEIRITYQMGQPIGGKVYYPGFLTLKDVTNRPVDSLEREAIETGRLLKWGDLSIHVRNGSPHSILNDSFQSIKFTPQNA